MKKFAFATLFLIQSIQLLAAPKIQSQIPVFKEMQETLDWLEKEEKLIPITDNKGLFLRVYHEVTNEMPAMFAEGQFKNPEWVQKLMFEYLSIYRNALDCEFSKSCPVSPAWQKAFLENSRNRYAPSIQLLLSISAHVNRDLPIALSQIQTDFDNESLHQDFRQISEIFNRRMPKLLEIMQTFQQCTLSNTDKNFINGMVIWAIRRTREQSWNFGRLLSKTSADAAEKNLLDRIEGHARFENTDIVILSPVPEKFICL